MENVPQNLPFNRDESMTASPATGVINIWSSSGEEFEVEPLSLAEIGESFRTGPFQLTDMPTALMGRQGQCCFQAIRRQGLKKSTRWTQGVLSFKTN